MSPMATWAKKTTATFSATLAALLTMLVCYWIFRWGFIHAWEWQHEGRRIVFVFGPEVNAAALAALPGIVAFLIVFRRSLYGKN